jgi:hypothetical protein
MKDLKHLISIINNYPSDIKAEILIADLIEKGFSPSDFIIFFSSAFKRGYSKDILKADMYPISSIQDILGIYLSRDGLYDLLPEGLFHASPDAALASGKGMALDSKKESRIEEDTRRFFQPFENEFFYHRTLIELQERTILQKLNENNLDDFFLDFWKIDSSLNKDLIIRLIAMLPFVREITGDFEMTARCLGAILDENVTYEMGYSSDMPVNEEYGINVNECALGKTTLGINMIMGSQLPENCKIVRFLIGPLKKSDVSPYLANGEIARFIKCFCGFFIPLEVDAGFDVIISQQKNGFSLESEKNSAVMGYNTII